MSYSTVFFDKADHLLCVTDGELSELDDCVRWAVAIIKRAQENGHKNVLVDNRTLFLKFSPQEAVAFAEALKQMGGVELGIRLAVISCPQNPEISNAVEEAFVERAAILKSFKSQASAMRWLLPSR